MNIVKFIFPKELQQFTNNQPQYTCKVLNYREAVSALFNQYPQLFVYVTQPEIMSRIALTLNGGLFTSSNGEAAIEDGDIFQLFVLPYGESEAIGAVVTVVMDTVTSAAGAIVSGIGQVASGIGIEMTTATAVSMVQGLVSGFFALVKMGIAFALSALIGALKDDVASPYASAASVASNSATYTFNGVRNTTASGTPFQLMYGTHRIGGQVLNIFVKSTSTYSDLYYQIGLCEGEIEGITDIELDKLPASYYNYVSSWTRNGSTYQEIMPEFSEVDSTQSIGRKVI